jgi:hypothetical protein
MSLKAISNKITSKVGRQILITQKHSPALLFGAGAIGFVATAVLASRATLKMDEVLKEAEENRKTAETLDHADYSEQDRKKDLSLVRVKTALKVAKLYAPAVTVGVVTLGCLTGSHLILSRRNVALTAAYAAVEKGFKEYRERVVAAYGEEQDTEFRFGSHEVEIAVDTDEGPVVKTVSKLDQRGSIYARLFDEYNPNWSKEWGYNRMFLRSQQNYANDLLKVRGHVFLNEVHDMLGMDHTSAGAVVGWVLGNGDNEIDFGIAGTFEGQRFINGDERSVLLDFNVDGVVYDLI